jgi:D-glycero-D-manno-heptose 1,7-bisphosphate phosphatase
VSTATRRRAAIFMDRDGTIIEDLDYPRDPAKVKLLPRAGESLAVLKDAGYALAIISNQSGVGRGLITADDVAKVNERTVELLRDYGVELDAVRYCLHAPDEGCDCRKPSPKMLLEAAGSLGVSIADSFMVGDKDDDVETGRRAGCKTVFLAGGKGTGSSADHVVSSWDEALRVIVGSRSRHGT